MPRDRLTTLALEQTLSIGTGADLATTNTNFDSGQGAGGGAKTDALPSGPTGIVMIVTNVDAADPMVNGVFNFVLTISTDSGGTFSDLLSLLPVPGAELGVGGSAQRRAMFSLNAFDEVNVLPTAIRLRGRSFTTGHTNAATVDITVTAYIEAGHGGYN